MAETKGRCGKRINWMAAAALSTALASAVPVMAQRGPERGQGEPQGGRTCGYWIPGTPLQDLDAKEAEQLTFMREEEKLARDVYRRMYELWQFPIFANIARSEQRHFESLGILIGRYKLSDPARDKAEGIFSDSRLATLYGDLVARGQASLAAALRVGATIEDLDIHDLEGALAASDNEDLKTVYQNLRRGSQNHLRAFVRQLESAGETYTAAYITPDALAAILQSPGESGRMMGGGRGRGRGGMGGYGRPWGRDNPNDPGPAVPRPPR